jgi:hypothetical protein
MSLYLCVFHGDVEVAGVEVGGYSDFGDFREMVWRDLEGGSWASRFPVLMNHPDADGEWAVTDLPDLQRELAVVAAHPAASSFRDTDDRSLAETLGHLAALAAAVGSPILFQ